jgi:hypothetical protein
VTDWPQLVICPHWSCSLPAGQTGSVQQAFWWQICPPPQVETIVPPQPSGLPLSPQFAGDEGEHSQTPLWQ